MSKVHRKRPFFFPVDFLDFLIPIFLRPNLVCRGVGCQSLTDSSTSHTVNYKRKWGGGRLHSNEDRPIDFSTLSGGFRSSDDTTHHRLFGNAQTRQNIPTERDDRSRWEIGFSFRCLENVHHVAFKNKIHTEKEGVRKKTKQNTKYLKELTRTGQTFGATRSFKRVCFSCVYLRGCEMGAL